MCISPRCFKRELSRGAPPPRPRNSSPAPISPNRSPCFISLFRCPAGRNNNPPSPNPRLPFAIPFSILRARRIPLRSRSFEKKHRLLLLLLLPRSDRAQVREAAPGVRSREESGIERWIFMGTDSGERRKRAKNVDRKLDISGGGEERSACVSGWAAQPRHGGKAGPLPPLSAPLQNGCISDAAASSLERLTRVCEPQLFMRGECSRGPRYIARVRGYRRAMNMHTLIRGAN